MYHIITRGNRKAVLFYDDRDRIKYLNLLEETRELYPFYLHSYCLMPNHSHLQLETIHHHPQKIMSMLNTRYAIYFNLRHDFVGHVFQGRYKAKLIDSLQYFLDVSRYIHLNPVEANIVTIPQDYLWSSYNAYISETPNPHVTTERILTYFPEPQKENYKQFMEEVRQDPYSLTLQGGAYKSQR